MDNPFRELSKSLATITERVIDETVLKVIRRNASYALDLNRAQLDAGKDREGFKLPPYTKAYAKKKGRKIPNLKLTGAFWKGFRLNADKFPISITSVDKKTDKLVERYGENIFNLSESNAKKFAAYCEPEIKIELWKIVRKTLHQKTV